eukprot:768175-Hanusia_phi.AAC.1
MRDRSTVSLSASASSCLIDCKMLSKSSFDGEVDPKPKLPPLLALEELDRAKAVPVLALDELDVCPKLPKPPPLLALDMTSDEVEAKPMTFTLELASSISD